MKYFDPGKLSKHSSPAARIVHPSEELRIVALDIGSNDIKCEGASFSANGATLIGEAKINCALARGTTRENRVLNPKSVKKAYKALERICKLVERWKIDEVYAYITGAGRYASEAGVLGDFLEQAQLIFGRNLSIISGKREAELQALGLRSKHSDADGIGITIGGSSFEAFEIHIPRSSFKGMIRHASELQLGTLSLKQESGGDPKRAGAIIDDELSKLTWLQNLRHGPDGGLSLYATGSLFRAQGRMLLKVEDRIPINAKFPRGVTLQAARLLPTLQKLSNVKNTDIQRQIEKSLIDDAERKAWEGIQKARIEDVQLVGAQLLEKMVKRTCATQIIFTDATTRDGIFYAIQNGIDISDRLSRPLSQRQRASLSRSAQARHV